LESPKLLGPASSGAFFEASFASQIQITFDNHPFSPMAHRSGRVIDTDMLISLVLQVSSDDQEREQGSEDNNPNVNAHQSRPAATLPVINLASRHYTRNISAESAVSLGIVPAAVELGKEALPTLSR
jgi:hypothetical protein